MTGAGEPGTDPPGRVERSDREWRERLTEEEYRVARGKGTEPAFSGRYLGEKAAGTYRCVCCGTPIFDASRKYDSGTGWPSFWDVADPRHVAEIEDRSHGMLRTEVVCAVCDAHLGHVFPDGPEPTGLRYCVNSVSLRLDPDEAPPDGAPGSGG